MVIIIFKTIRAKLICFKWVQVYSKYIKNLNTVINENNTKVKINISRFYVVYSNLREKSLFIKKKKKS